MGEKGKSLGLDLYLRFASRGGAGTFDAAGQHRPEGPLIWFCVERDTPLKSIAQLATRMQRERSALSFLVTRQGEILPDLTGFPDGTASCAAPPDKSHPLRAFLDHWRPSAILPTGAAPAPALVHEAGSRDIPVILLDAQMSPQEYRKWSWRFGMARAVLSGVALILARDHESALHFHNLDPHSPIPEVTGRIEETTEPLPVNESDREALTELLTARPVWLAIECPKGEEDAVMAAQARAMRLAHRMLLILVPADPRRGPEIAERAETLGWTAALWSRGREPDPDVQVFIADSDDEPGLWYRLAPVTYMGGTLTQAGRGRNPFEPAALGSAILHGPNLLPYPEGYQRLSNARAARAVADGVELADAVCELIAPDRAALLAHNAWQVSSSGAEVTERVVKLIFRQIDAGGTAH